MSTHDHAGHTWLGLLSNLFPSRTARHRPSNRRTQLEALEDRRMLAVLSSATELDDEPRHLADGEDRLTGEKTASYGGLTYSSATLPRPIISAEAVYTWPAYGAELTSFDVELRLKSPDGPTYDAVANKNYPVSTLIDQELVRFALQVDASTFTDTGNYEWEMNITSHYSNHADEEDQIEGQQFISNRETGSEFGQGWWLAGFSRLYDTLDGVGLVDSYGQVVFFPEDGGDYDIQPPDQRVVDSLVQNVDDSYTLTYVNGTVCEFDDDGMLLSCTDRNGNETEYEYTGPKLTTITDVSGRETTLVYDGVTGLLDSITDFAGRSTLYEYDGEQLVTITYPAPDGLTASPEIECGYGTDDNEGLLTQITDARGFSWYVGYDEFRRISGTSGPTPDGLDLSYTYMTSIQSSGALEESPIQPSTLRIGSYTDAFERTSYFEASRFGDMESVNDPNGWQWGNFYDALGRRTDTVADDPDGTGPRGIESTYYTYDETYLDKVASVTYIVGALDNEINEETDDITYSFTYGVFGQVASSTDSEGRVTTYDLAADGNVLAMTQEGNLSTSADDLVTRYTYTVGGNGIPAGLVASMTDPNGATTFYEYYAAYEGYNRAGQLKRVIYPDTTVLEEVTPVGSPVIIDDLDTEYDDVGGWSNAGDGYDDFARVVQDGDAEDVATWTFDDLDPGRYRVSATWYAHAQFFVTEAPYTIFDGMSPRDKVLVNQRVAPNDVLASGVMWDYLSVVDITGDELVVKLAGSGEIGHTIADAIRIERVGDLPTSDPEIAVIAGGRNIADELGRASFGTTQVDTPVSLTFTVVNVGTDTLTLSGSPSVPDGFTLVSSFGDSTLDPGQSTTFVVELDADTGGNFSGQITLASDDASEGTFNFMVTGTATVTRVVDDGGSGYTAVGDWDELNTFGYGGDFDFVVADPGEGDSYVTWTFTGLDEGDYRVYADWAKNPFYATDAPYTIYDNTTLVDSEEVDLTYNPEDLFAELFAWGQIGGIVHIASGTLKVKLTNDADGYVFADAIRIERADVNAEAPYRAEQRFDYSATGKLNVQMDELGRVSRTFYDRLDRAVLQESADPDGPGGLPVMSIVYEYDAGGNVLSVFDTAGTETAYEYTPQGWVTSVTRGVGETDPTTTEWTYDVTGRKLSETVYLDALEGDDRVTTWEYDDAERTITTTLSDPDGGGGGLAAPVYVRLFDPLGNLLRETAPDPDGEGMTYESPVTDYTYNRLNQVLSITGPEVASARPVTEYVYTKGGQVLSAEDAEGRSTVNTYDDFGRLETVTDELSQTTTYGYDANSNQTSITDDLTNVTSFVVDARNRRIAVVDARDGVTRYRFDAAGNLLALTDPVGNTTRWVYDSLNRPIAETNELGDTRSTFYNDVGDVVKMIDRNERVRQFDYDPLHRQTEERWMSGMSAIHTFSMEYNDAGELTHIEDEDSEYTYTYDALGRVTVVDNDGSPDVPNVVLTAGYDVLSRRTSLAAEIDSTDDFLNSYTYDARGQMRRVDQAGQSGGNSVAEKRVDFSYNLAGQFTQIVRYKDTDGGSGNEVVTTAYTYDPNVGLLTDLVHTHGVTTIASYEWEYDELNRVESFDWGADSVDYGYNNNGELTSANYVTQADETYAFDANGNRTAYTTGANNQLTDDGTFEYTYDDEGNRLTRTRKSGTTDDHTTEYTWDYRNRLTRVAFKNNADALTKAVDFVYDALGRRTGKLVDIDGDLDIDTEQRYVYDGDHIVLVFNGAGSLTNRFLPGPAVDQIMSDEQIGNQVYWPTADNLGSVRDVLESDGDVANHITYDAFGKRLSETNSAVDHLFGYTGRELDEETGLQYNRARYYDSAVGRWIGEDPMGFSAGDSNLSRYVGNGPTNAIDPTGREIYGALYDEDSVGAVNDSIWRNEDGSWNWDKVPWEVHTDDVKISIFDASDKDSSRFAGQAHNLEDLIGGKSIGVSSLSDAMPLLREYVAKYGRLDSITISSHGNPDGPHFGDDNIGITMGEWGALKDLMDLKSGGATIAIYACVVGRNDGLIQAIADVTECEVFASRGFFHPPQLEPHEDITLGSEIAPWAHKSPTVKRPYWYYDGRWTPIGI